ncbi:MAG: SUMF1/EgtB/PvdO family nonheme iron enzyme [Mariniphaga sp.]
MKPDRVDIPTIPKVFISYNHKDQEVALKIKDRLESSGIKVIIDVEAMSTGENISEFIKKCIHESGITLSLISSNSLMSAWVAMETIWSSYDETLRNRYFLPCNIDNSFFKISFTDQTLDVIEERTSEVSDTISYRLKKGRGIDDLAGEHTRLNRLKFELPSIISRLKNSLCVSLIEGHFDSGMEKVIKDILNKKAVSTEPIQIEIPKKSKPTTKSPKPLKEVKKTLHQKGLQTPKLDGLPPPETLGSLEDPKVSDNSTPNATPNPTQITIAGIEMVFVKGGEFIMGDDNSGYDREKPVHKVFISDFYIGKYPVTQKQWTELTGSNPSYFKGDDNCPVEQVRWDDAQNFLKILNLKTGKTFRLPTEAEWEYAAGGGALALRTKWAGTSNERELGDYAWYNKNSDGKTHPVGTKTPNSLGIYDMSGNVWEWCNDSYSDNYYEECNRNGLVKNPTGPDEGSFRVLRGGSWNYYADYSRVACRSNSTPISRWNDSGFRILLAL